MVFRKKIDILTKTAWFTNIVILSVVLNTAVLALVNNQIIFYLIVNIKLIFYMILILVEGWCFSRRISAYNYGDL